MHLICVQRTREQSAPVRHNCAGLGPLGHIEASVDRRGVFVGYDGTAKSGAFDYSPRELLLLIQTFLTKRWRNALVPCATAPDPLPHSRELTLGDVLPRYRTPKLPGQGIGATAWSG
jgi:hypothetical protein